MSQSTYPITKIVRHQSKVPDHRPIHPGVYFRDAVLPYLKRADGQPLTKIDVAKDLEISRAHLHRILSGKQSLTSKLADRLSIYSGDARFWMQMQLNHEFWTPDEVMIIDTITDNDRLTTRVLNLMKKMVPQVSLVEPASCNNLVPGDWAKSAKILVTMDSQQASSKECIAAFSNQLPGQRSYVLDQSVNHALRNNLLAQSVFYGESAESLDDDALRGLIGHLSVTK